MKGVLNITALNNEVSTPIVLGVGSFTGYLSARNMQAGDTIEIIQYIDIDTDGAPEPISTTQVSYNDIVASGDTAIDEIPFILEELQQGKIGVKLISGTFPLDIGYRITNILTSL